MVFENAVKKRNFVKQKAKLEGGKKDLSKFS